MTHSDLMATLPDVEWEVGNDQRPGRFYATARWDDEQRHLHETLSTVNEPSLLAAVEGVLEEWHHSQERPDLHF